MSMTLTVREVADALRVSKQAVHAWEKQGLPFVRTPGRRSVQIRLDDLEAWFGCDLEEIVSLYTKKN